MVAGLNPMASGLLYLRYFSTDINPKINLSPHIPAIVAMVSTKITTSGKSKPVNTAIDIARNAPRITRKKIVMSSIVTDSCWKAFQNNA